MTKTTKVENAQGAETTQANEQVNEIQNEVVATTTELIAPNLLNSEKLTGLLNGLDEMESSLSLNFKYLDLKKDDKARFAFMGYTELNMKNDNGEDIVHVAVKLLDSKKSIFVSSAVALVRIFKQADLEICTPVEIEHTGTQKRVKLYDVRILM